jgi:fatty acid desaturase (delta-4 desaturase)
VLNVIPLFIVGGYYLSFFFVISHNFEGVQLFEKEYGQKVDPSFLRRQVATAANVCGAKLAFLNGGLNYQIEHHLFPRISHAHYPTIAPVVRQFCEERGVPYVHYDTIWENTMATVRHMRKMGHGDIPEGFKTALSAPPVDPTKIAPVATTGSSARKRAVKKSE